MSGESVPVLVGECLCPGAPHEDGDSVYLRAKLGLSAGILLQRVVIEGNQNKLPAAQIAAELSEAYLQVGVASWNLLDDEGPVPVTPDTIRSYLLEDFARATPVANRADELYAGPVILPLFPKAAVSSNTSTTNGSTSPIHLGQSKRPKRSKPSSTSTSPMAVIGPTSP